MRQRGFSRCSSTSKDPLRRRLPSPSQRTPLSGSETATADDHPPGALRPQRSMTCPDLIGMMACCMDAALRCDAQTPSAGIGRSAARAMPNVRAFVPAAEYVSPLLIA